MYLCKLMGIGKFFKENLNITKFLLLSVILHGAILFLPFPNGKIEVSPVKMVFTSETISSPSYTSLPSYSHTIPLSSSEKRLSSIHALYLPIPSIKYNLTSHSPSDFDYSPSFSTKRLVKFSYPEVGGSEKEKNKYFQIIKRRIEEVKFYPEESIEREEEGIVILDFSINRNGEASNVHLSKSSGINRLDKAGIEIIRRASPFPTPPFGKSLSIKLPIKFVIKK